MHDMGSLNYDMDWGFINDIRSKPFKSMMLPFNEAGLELEFEYSQKNLLLWIGDADRLHSTLLESGWIKLTKVIPMAWEN